MRSDMQEFPSAFRDLDHLAEALRKFYPPRCIGPKDTEVLAHRYAGAVALAERIIRCIDAPDPSDNTTEVEIR